MSSWGSAVGDRMTFPHFVMKKDLASRLFRAFHFHFHVRAVMFQFAVDSVFQFLPEPVFFGVTV